MLYIQLLTAIIVLIQAVKCGRAPTWINCNCRFLQWTSWSQCTVTCGTGGTRVRTRKIRLTIKKGCSKFTDCATNDEGSQRDSCNRICYNSGAWTSGGCRCTDGWRGRCCGDRVNCGSPGNIVNGHVTGNDFSYGKSVTYICNNLHNMTGGQGVRTCTKDGLWSGTAPQCIYVHTCLSNPCQNGGTCINGLNSYTCQCLPGWSGVNCDRDVQPPMMSGCPSDINITTDKRNKLVNWTEPAFHDPMGTHVSVTKNFPTSQWQFPWGDFKIQIVASKPSNGLSTECVFNVRVRPHTCSDLNIPNFGAKVCNDWKKDLGRYCLVFCDVRHDVYPGIYSNRWFVCGASGEWKPGNRLPDCEASYSRDQRRHEFHFESCTNATDVARLQQTYIDRLKSSHYSYFCSAFSDLCSPANVEVIC